MTTDARDDTRRRLAGLYLPTMAVAFGQGLVLTAVPALAARFHVSPGLAAQVVSAYAAGRLMALLPSGVLADRLPPGLVLLIASLCFVAGAAGMVLAPVFWALLAGQWLIGVGGSLWLTGREISGLTLVRPDQRGRLMSGFFGFQLAGAGIGPVVGGILADRGGIAAVLWANLIVAVAVALETTLARGAFAPHGSPPPRAPEQRGRGTILPENRRMFLILVYATFAMHVGRYSLNSLLPLYGGITLGLSGTQVGALFGISSVFIPLMIVPAGFVLDRVGRKWAAVPAALIPAAVFLLFPAARTVAQLSALMAVMGIATGLSLGSLSTFSYDVIPERARGRLQALRRIFGELGTLGGPLAGGVIADRSRPAAAFIVYVPLLALAAILLAFGTRETLARPGPAVAEARR
ncbi:MAG TPA: MFS transporter [bacterium]|nr:MFS transporter [bacterium]